MRRTLSTAALIVIAALIGCAAGAGTAPPERQVLAGQLIMLGLDIASIEREGPTPRNIANLRGSAVWLIDNVEDPRLRALAEIGLDAGIMLLEGKAITPGTLARFDASIDALIATIEDPQIRTAVLAAVTGAREALASEGDSVTRGIAAVRGIAEALVAGGRQR